MTTSDPLHDTIGRALGRVPSGVFILTARDGQRSAAMMASWVQQVAFQPPSVSIAVSRDRPIAQLILGTRRLALSILGEDDSALMKLYARGTRPDADPFENVRVTDTPGGVPVLADALAWLEAELVQTVDFGADHDIFIARVTNGALLKTGVQPFTHVRGNGFHY